MQNIRDERQRRLRDLIREKYGDSQAVFAKTIGKADNYVSRMLSNGPARKNIGEDMAREIERSCGLPHGWLDGNAAPKREPAIMAVYGLPITPDAAEIGREWAKLEEPMRSLISTLIHTLVAADVRAKRPMKSLPPPRPSAHGQGLTKSS